MIACLLLQSWSLKLLTRQYPGVPAAVLTDGGRVICADQMAIDAGVTPGQPLHAALSRCPELHAEVGCPAQASAAWAEVLELIYSGFSDRVHSPQEGLAFVKTGLGPARQLAALFGAPVGLGSSTELAQLAALRALPGEVRTAGTSQAEQAFLMLTPLPHLSALGLTERHIERLQFLGIDGLAALMKWSAAQREAFLGVETGRRLNRFLRGERTSALPLHQAPLLLSRSLEPDAPLTEPGEAAAALIELASGLWEELQGRTAAQLRVKACTLAGEAQATRQLKRRLDARDLARLAELTLQETQALPLGIERLTRELSGLSRPARMTSLFARTKDLDVTGDLLRRFPQALVKVEWLDEYAYVADARYRWVDWVSGEPCPRRLTPLPPEPSPRLRRVADPVRAHQRFFEGEG